MVQLTIDLPEELATRLTPVKSRLPTILELGLRQYLSGEFPLQHELADFLASSPSPDELIRYRPSQSVLDRVYELLDKNQEGRLTDAEENELDQIETIDHLMTLVKARSKIRVASLA